LFMAKALQQNRSPCKSGNAENVNGKFPKTSCRFHRNLPDQPNLDLKVEK